MAPLSTTADVSCQAAVHPSLPRRRAGVVTSMAVADKLVAASIAKQKPSGRRLTATNEELGLVDGQTWYWCRDSKTKDWKKCDVASAIAGNSGGGSSSGGGGGGGGGGGNRGGTDDALAEKAARQAAAAEREQSSRGPKVSAATNTDGWMYSNTGGFYRYVPHPLLNAFVVSPAGWMTDKLVMCAAIGSRRQAGPRCPAAALRWVKAGVQAAALAGRACRWLPIVAAH